jgi:hypothetical protein
LALHNKRQAQRLMGTVRDAPPGTPASRPSPARAMLRDMVRRPSRASLASSWAPGARHRRRSIDTTPLHDIPHLREIGPPHPRAGCNDPIAVSHPALSSDKQ